MRLHLDVGNPSSNCLHHLLLDYCKRIQQCRVVHARVAQNIYNHTADLPLL